MVIGGLLPPRARRIPASTKKKVVQASIDGMTNEDIAKRYTIHPGTVSKIVSSVSATYGDIEMRLERMERIIDAMTRAVLEMDA